MLRCLLKYQNPAVNPSGISWKASHKRVNALSVPLSSHQEMAVHSTSEPSVGPKCSVISDESTDESEERKNNSPRPTACALKGEGRLEIIWMRPPRSVSRLRSEAVDSRKDFRRNSNCDCEGFQHPIAAMVMGERNRMATHLLADDGELRRVGALLAIHQ